MRVVIWAEHHFRLYAATNDMTHACTIACYRFTYIQNGNLVLSTAVTAMCSTTSYSAIDYLLDKANIHDTVTKGVLVSSHIPP